MRYFKGDSVPNLDTNLIILAEDSKAKTTTLFNDNIDLTCHTTEDYKRLKKFLVPWYASLRSFSSTMRSASDVRSLPEDHLNQLINSFGFVDSLEDISKSNKIDFFYDLVNLYKIKGTPTALERILFYFGIPNVELIEYWLQYDNDNNLIFHPVIIGNDVTGSSAYNIDFETITNNDPHWFLKKNEINQLFLNNKIAFPSKTPYFGLRPLLQISGSNINPNLAILSRIIQDMYSNYLSGVIPNKDLIVSDINVTASILDIYLAWAYSFNYINPKTQDTNDDCLMIYNGSMNNTYDSIIELYNNITSRKNIDTRDELKNKQELLNTYFTRLKSTSFLIDLNTAGTILQVLNPTLKSSIDNLLQIDNETYILKVLIKNLSFWIKKNISSYTSDLSVITFGFSALTHLSNVINFFKPYRSRLVTVEHNFIIDNPLHDTVITEDSFRVEETNNFIDYDTADSIPGYEEGSVINEVYSTPPTDLSRRIYDIYVDSIGEIKYTYEVSEIFTGIQNSVYSTPPAGSYRVTNIFLEIPLDGIKVLYIEYDSIPVSASGVSTNIVSIAPVSYYNIYNIYINDDGDLELVYDDDIVIDPIIKKYYTRNTYDNGSFFDIGASIDLDNYHLLITQNDNIMQNYHKGDATFDYNYTTDSTGNVIYALIDSGWSDFDTGMVFDSSMQSDVIQIKVYDVISQIVQTEDDGSVDDHSLDVNNLVVGMI
jgi:hypothetical protein